MSEKNQENTGERIAKRIAAAGVCSRRDAERLITEGKVKVNGKTIKSPALNVTIKDAIEINGEEIGKRKHTRLWLYHKPKGLITTSKDEMGRETVFENLPPDMPRVISVGRLDMNTEGLLLLTNDGEFSRYLELPSTGIERKYRVRAFGRVSQAKLDKLKDGIMLEGIQYGPIDAFLESEQGSNCWIEMTLQEGKNREIRKVLEHLGLTVNRLIRISYGVFELGDIKPGKTIEVKADRLKKLFKNNVY